MKTFVLFLAIISFAAASQAQNCTAHFSYSQSSGVVYFTNESTPIDSFTNFYWTFGDGTTSTLVNPSHNYPYAWQYDACLTITNSQQNCSSTFCDSVYVDSTNFFGNCVAAFADSVSGNDVVFYNQSTWDTAQATFQWNFGDGTTSTDFAPTHHYDQNGFYYACLTISTTDGCTNYTCSYVEIYDSSCAISFIPQISGSTVQFIPNNANYGTGTYYWTFGDNSTSSDVAPTHTYLYPGNYSICLWYSDSSCSAMFCDSIFITQSDSCYASFYSYEYSNGMSFHPTFVDPTKTYSWNFGDGGTSTDISPYHPYANAGYYYVCLTVSSFLCSTMQCDTVHYWGDTTNNNGGNCLAHFVVSSIDSTTSTVWLTDYSVGGNSFYWDFGDGTFSTEQYPTHTYAQNENYYVCLTITCDSNMTSEYCAWVGLGDSLQSGNGQVRSGFTLNVKSATVSGVVSPSPNESLSVYPNPATESVNLVLPSKVKGNAVVIITNDVGQLVNQKSIHINEGTVNEVDLHSLVPGLYLIRVVASGKSFSANILKQ